MATFLTAFTVVVLVGFVMAQVDKAKIMEALNNCQSQINADPSDLEAVQNKQPPPSDKGKCLVACMMEAGGIMKDGKYSLEGSLASAEEMFGDNADNLALAKDTAQKCQGEVEAANVPNKCDLSMAIVTCFKKNAGSLSGSL